MSESNPRNIIERFVLSVSNILEVPVVWVREKLVKPNQKHSVWYHKKFRRLPTIDECYTDDVVCIAEANSQFKRDKLVDNNILSILRERYEECVLFENPDHSEKCKPLFEQYQGASTNWFIKYGDLGAYGDARTAYMKQKYKIIWERRHGPVGSGIKEASPAEE